MSSRLPVLQNFQAQCLDDMRKALRTNVSLQELESSFCVHCRSSQCSEAKWADSKWDARILSQEDRLLNNPQFSDLTSGHHQELHVLDFPSLLQKAMRLEIADRRGDWELVSEPEEAYVSADGKPETSDSGTDAFEAAMAAFKGNKPAPQVPKLGGGLENPLGGAVDRKAPPSRVPPPESEPEPEPAKAPNTAPQAFQPAPGLVEGPKAPEPSTEPVSGPEQYVGLLQALPMIAKVEVKEGELHAFCKQGANMAALPKALGGQAIRYHVPAAPQMLHNTQVPAGGIMIDGSAPPPAQDAPAPKPAHDPWEVPKERRVKPGAVIKMGSDD